MVCWVWLVVCGVWFVACVVCGCGVWCVVWLWLGFLPGANDRDKQPTTKTVNPLCCVRVVRCVGVLCGCVGVWVCCFVCVCVGRCVGVWEL